MKEDMKEDLEVEQKWNLSKFWRLFRRNNSFSIRIRSESHNWINSSYRELVSGTEVDFEIWVVERFDDSLLCPFLLVKLLLWRT